MQATAAIVAMVTTVMSMTMGAMTVVVAGANAAAAAVAFSGGVTIDNVAVRLALPEGPGLSGVCLYRNGPDKRRHVMFKSVASARKKSGLVAGSTGGGGGGDSMVAGDLTADRVYEGTFARLEDGDQVARFECNGGQRFEIATPFVVPEPDLDTILAVKESMERRFGGRPSRRTPHRSVTADHVSVTLRGLRPPGAAAGDAVTVDVFQLYKKPTAAAVAAPWNAKVSARYSAYPYARYALRHPVGNLMLADLPPDQMLAVKYRRSSGGAANRTAENALFIYTGGLYPRGTANLTDMLDERSALQGTYEEDNVASDTAAAATTAYQIDAKQAHRDSYGKPFGWRAGYTL